MSNERLFEILDEIKEKGIDPAKVTIYDNGTYTVEG